MGAISGKEKYGKRFCQKEKKEGKRGPPQCIGKGRYCSSKFWEKAKRRASKAPKSLKNKQGKLHREEVSMAEIAKEPLNQLGKDYPAMNRAGKKIRLKKADS